MSTTPVRVPDARLSDQMRCYLLVDTAVLAVIGTGAPLRERWADWSPAEEDWLARIAEAVAAHGPEVTYTQLVRDYQVLAARAQQVRGRVKDALADRVAEHTLSGEASEVFGAYVQAAKAEGMLPTHTA